MAELTVKQTTEYLKQISELETSVYKQTEVRKKAKKELKMPEVKKQTVKKPEKYDILSPTAPSFAESLIATATSSAGIIVVEVIGVICFIFFLLSGTIEDDETWLWLNGVTAFVVFAIVLLRGLSDYLIDKRAYPKALNDYKLRLEQNNILYEKNMKEYEVKSKKAEESYKKASLAATNVYKIASNEVAKLDKPLEETQAILNKLYDADIIFPKYRNMVAMCTIYEYFASGRCTELTGATGAYNLYESELRQNLIINQLEEVNANLEQVRQNQYILYQGISETNKTLSEVSGDIKGILSMTKDIAISSRINAFCSQITAANVKALTYMETYEYITQ